MENLLEYKLPKEAYANFDAVSLKQFIINRLNENPQFTDQNYEGSNLSSFIDIIAYSYHVLLFYLNQTSSETLFSQTSLYENMNRIVALLGYKPTGKQTSLLCVNCVADAALAIGSYKIKKYSYFLIDGVQYTVLDDFVFEKTTNATEDIESINNNLVLYQGSVKEYPVYTALGEDYESLSIVVDNIVEDSKFIVGESISVFVKEINDNKWYEYSEEKNLYLSGDNDRVYDLRLNENGHYEIKFGNGIIGKKLNAGDQVAIFYILSDGEAGIVSRSAVNGKKLFEYNSQQYNEIYQAIFDTLSIKIDITNNGLLSFSNPLPSSPISEAETVTDIRNNLPILNNANIRLVTEADYDTYLQKAFPNIINSVKVVSNTRYIQEYLQYFYDICVDPNKTTRVILNNVNFADSCDFNNVNVFIVPNFNLKNDASYPPFSPNTFKNTIIEDLSDRKMISHEIVPRDPIYMAYDIGYSNNDPVLSTRETSKLRIVRNLSNKISKEILKNRVKDVILDFFNSKNNKLGGKIDLSTLTSNILKIEGVDTIRTVNGNEIFNGISFVTWNPLYEESDIDYVTQTITLPFFKFPYFYSPQSLINKIEVIDE
jgi:hypothetical protein